MKCRICQGEVAFVMRDGKQVAIHASAAGEEAGPNLATPSPGQQRKLRQKLEEECRQAHAKEGAEPGPEIRDDVQSVQEATPEEYKTFVV